jgi:hypothetical protein
MIDQAYVDLYWIPLGAGGWFVRRNGRLYEALVAARDGRRRCDLYHSALEVVVPEGRFVLEQAPVPRRRTGQRGVVAQGPVGLRAAGRLRLFRYEVRRWRDGRIPDVAEAVESPRRLSVDSSVAHRVLALAPDVPTPVWGRDELRTGDMWNSNAVISWLITRSGLDPEEVPLPPGGRAPGWDAGMAAARLNLVGPGLRPAPSVHRAVPGTSADNLGLMSLSIRAGREEAGRTGSGCGWSLTTTALGAQVRTSRRGGATTRRKQG